MIHFEELKSFLDQKAEEFQNPNFIEHDPMQIPHRFELKQDIEIAGFLTATISWGNRKSIINSATQMMNHLGNNPYDFVLSFSERDLDFLTDRSVHRTFNGEDLKQFLWNLKRLYKERDSLESYFQLQEGETDFYHGIERFRTSFLGPTKHRSSKHVSSPYKNSAAKRIMMYLRWMVRSSTRGVDFGLWESLDPKYLSVPLDVHTGNISRKLGLVERVQNDWKTVRELDLTVRKMDPTDPAKYDFALFGLGVTKEL
ncbi:TIGR02757 family protein [Chryseobacterium sp. A321]